MQLHRYTSIARFADATRSFLARHEAQNNLLLGISAGLGEQPASGHAPYLAVIEDADGGPTAVALRTPPWNLLLSWPFPDSAVDLVADPGTMSATNHAASTRPQRRGLYQKCEIRS